MQAELLGAGALIVIPTRNRASLASRAIRSVLDQAETRARILVSDNSTIDTEVDALAEFCRGLPPERVRYVRPPAPLPMAAHWEWALGQARADGSVSHVAYLTDRMIFRAGTLTALLRLSARYPDRVISYNHDVVLDHVRPVLVRQVSWTGRVFELPSVDLLAASARVCRQIFFMCLPRMLNCIVPRAVFDAITAVFGDVFLSVPPDLVFAYRCLDRLDSILYYDRAVLVSYAHTRSSGTSYGRGVESPDYVDFVANLGGQTLNHAAPVPEFKTVTNAVIHAYRLVSEQARSGKFLPVDRRRYLDAIADELVGYENVRAKEEMLALLEKQRAELPERPRPALAERVSVLTGKVKRLSPGWLMATERPRALWALLDARFGIEPRGHRDKQVEFATVEAALAYSERHERARNWGRALIELRPSARVR